MPRVALACGCFDVIHAGHIEHLKAAAALADQLVVALTSDELLTKEKGPARPIHRFDERAAVLAELKSVWKVVPCSDLAALILKEKPHVLVKGHDWLNRLPMEVISACAETGTTIAFTMTRKLSSSAIIQKITHEIRL